jgi:hypothetical protein
MAPAWSTNLSATACNVQVASAREDRPTPRQQGVTEYDVYFAYGTDIKSADHILPTTGIAANLTLEVTSPPQDHAGHQSYSMVTARNIKAGGMH